MSERLTGENQDPLSEIAMTATRTHNPPGKSWMSRLAGAFGPRARRPIVRPTLECLGDRSLPAVTAGFGWLAPNVGMIFVQGTDEADFINVRQVHGTISVDGVGGSVPASAVQLIVVNAAGGNDVVNLASEMTAGQQPITALTVIDGGDGNDLMVGAVGTDYIFGASGNDRINANAGNDLVCGGPGDDWVQGWTGDDILGGNAGNDSIYGAAGHDVIEGADGADYLDGGDGIDVLWGGGGADVLLGGSGYVNYFVWDGYDSIYVGAGQATGWYNGGLTAVQQAIAHQSQMAAIANPGPGSTTLAGYSTTGPMNYLFDTNYTSFLSIGATADPNTVTGISSRALAGMGGSYVGDFISSNYGT